MEALTCGSQMDREPSGFQAGGPAWGHGETELLYSVLHISYAPRKLNASVCAVDILAHTRLSSWPALHGTARYMPQALQLHLQRRAIAYLVLQRHFVLALERES